MRKALATRSATSHQIIFIMLAMSHTNHSDAFSAYLGDDGASHGCTQQVLSLVDGTSADAGEHIVTDELLLEVANEQLAGTAGLGLGLQSISLTHALANIGTEADDFAAVILPGGKERTAGRLASESVKHLLRKLELLDVIKSMSNIVGA